MLFFLWGVFRGKKVNCSDALKTSNICSKEAVPLDKNFPDIIATKSDDVCLAKCVDVKIFACDVPKFGNASSSADQTSDTTSTDCRKCESSFHQTQLNSLENSGRKDDQFELKASSMLATSMEYCQGSASSAPMVILLFASFTYSFVQVKSFSGAHFCAHKLTIAANNHTMNATHICYGLHYPCFSCSLVPQYLLFLMVFFIYNPYQCFGNGNA